METGNRFCQAAFKTATHMRIGILTFHRAENFGAVFQVYALQTYLERLGAESYVMDYRCKMIESMYHIFSPAILISRKNFIVSFRLYIDRFHDLRARRQKKKKYKNFRQRYLRMTVPFKAIRKPLDFDAYIVGSDQVWNLHLTGGFDHIYFLDFPMKSGVTRWSYAASADIDPHHLLLLYRDKTTVALSRFDGISVREEFLKDELSRIIPEKNIEVCLDPTFLLGKSDYLKIAVRPEQNKYVLVYHMAPMPEGSALAKVIARNENLQAVEISGGYPKDIPNCKCDLGPEEILSYIAFADKVITTSFHGLALSLIFEKEFWVVDKGNNLRQRNLLKLIGCENRLINCVDDYSDVPLDYAVINKKLHGSIEMSKAFLSHVLNGR